MFSLAVKELSAEWQHPGPATFSVAAKEIAARVANFKRQHSAAIRARNYAEETSLLAACTVIRRNLKHLQKTARSSSITAMVAHIEDNLDEYFADIGDRSAWPVQSRLNAERSRHGH